MVSGVLSEKTLRTQDRGSSSGSVHHDADVGSPGPRSWTPRSLTRLLALMMELLGVWYFGGD